MKEHSRKPLEVGHNVGGYGIVRVIGQGGFGIVYEAINGTTRERVAIKQFYPNAISTWQHGTIVVNREDDRALVAKVLRRFEDEAALQFNFAHPNILRVKNFIRADNTGYMITEYVDGGSLLDALKPHGSVFANQEAFRSVMEPILDALRYVHERRTLHRDISPDNIMVDSSGKAILVDFGAAKFDLRASSSMSSVVQFREDYAPIEQQFPSAERQEGYHTDIFAVAGTMYRVLSGKPPPRAVARALDSHDPYVSIAEVAKTRCSEAVYAAIDRGLAMAASARPATVTDFVELLGWGKKLPKADQEGSVKPPKAFNVAKDVLALTPELPGLDGPNLLPSFDPQWAPGMMATPVAPAPRADGEPPPPQPQLPPPLPGRPPEDPPALAQQARSTWRSYFGVLLILGGSIALLKFISAPDIIRLTSRSTHSFRTFENTDLNGSNFVDPLQPQPTADQQGCETACSQQAGCVGYSYEKGEKRCRLKQRLTSQRFQPGLIAAVREDQPIPPVSTIPRSIEKVQRAISGNRYSTSSSPGFSDCKSICESEDKCLGFQFSQGACWRYDRIDQLTTQKASAGIKRQAASQ